MITAGQIYDAMDRLAPFSTAMSWDNVGLLIGGRKQPVHRVLLALDLTGPVLEEAAELGCQLVVTHHPVVFQPLKRLDADGLPYRAASAGVGVISAHTNLDMAQGGVNDALARCLGLRKVEAFVPECSEPFKKLVVFVPVNHAESLCDAMSEAGGGLDGNYSHCAFLTRGEGRFLPLEGAKPAIGSVGALERVEEIRVEMLCPPDRVHGVVAAMKAAHPYEQPAYDILDNQGAVATRFLGRVGELDKVLSARELCALVKDRTGAAGVRYVDGGSPIQRVAVIGGSGGDYVAAAVKAGAQALVTGEAKHHQLLEAAALGITLAEGGHFATENVVMEPLGRFLQEAVPGLAVALSRRCTDGVQYLA